MVVHSLGYRVVQAIHLGHLSGQFLRELSLGKGQYCAGRVHKIAAFHIFAKQLLEHVARKGMHPAQRPNAAHFAIEGHIDC